jgi:hypothetical protein
MFLKNSLRNGRLVDPNVFTHLVSFPKQTRQPIEACGHLIGLRWGQYSQC